MMGASGQSSDFTRIGVLSLLVSLSACAVIDFGSGAAASGGAGGGVQASGGAGAASGPSAGGAGGALACTADLTSDSAHCGACGHDCFGGECVASVCQPVVIWTSPSAESVSFCYGVTVAEDKVVWVGDSGTLSLPTTAAPDTAPFVISPDAGTRIMYEAPLLFRSWGALITSPLTGGGDGVWGSGECNRDLARDSEGNTFCVFASGVDEVGGISRFSATYIATPLVDSLVHVFGIAVDDEYVYVGHQGGITRGNRLGFFGPTQTLFDNPVFGQLVLVGGQLYFGAADALMRLDVATGDAVALVDGVRPGSIHIDAQHIYFSYWGDPALRRVDLDGQNLVEWPLPVPNADVVAGDDMFVFFTTDDSGKLFRLRK